jgi:hypothetical protein
MKISVPYVMVLGTLLLAGCGSKSDANVKDLSDATNAYLAKKGQLCLGISAKSPVDLQDSDQRAGSVKASEMAALEKVGLVHSQNAEAEYTTLSGRPAKAKVLREKINRNDPRIFVRDVDSPRTSAGQPLMAVHAFRPHSRIIDIDSAKEPGVRAILALAGSVTEIPDYLFATGRRWEPSGMVARHPEQKQACTSQWRESASPLPIPRCP